MQFHPLALLAIVVSCVANAAPASAPVRAEIDALLNALSSSRCEFNRNGSWHNAADAKAHLLRKLEYLEKSNKVTSTEQFIALAASSSSASGKAYQVKCSDGKPLESKTWMLSQLKAVRGSLPGASAAK